MADVFEFFRRKPELAAAIRCSAAGYEIRCEAARDVVGDHLRGTAFGIIHRSEAIETLVADRVVRHAG